MAKGLVLLIHSLAQEWVGSMYEENMTGTRKI